MKDSLRSLATYRRTVELNPWIRPPLYPKQQYFLLNSDVNDVFYGGAGGGGKSHALLLGAIQFVHVPKYAAVIFRRTLRDLDLPGALMDRARDYLRGTSARWNAARKTWVFPSGATLTFAYLENEADKLRYRSAEFQYIAFDELTQFTETQFRYLFTRLRRTRELEDAGVPLRMRSASNPGGPGHAWVKKRYIDNRTRPKTSLFIPARMSDNASLDIESYRSSLSQADALTRMQIEEGLWDAVLGGRFRREDFQRYQWDGDFVVSDRWRFNPNHRPRILTCDWNSSEKTTADFTVISDWCLAPNNDLVWLECERFHAEIPEIIPAVKRHVRRWKPSIVGIEAVAANNAVAAFLERSTDVAMTVKRLSPMGKDKLIRATPAIIRCERKTIYLPDQASNLFPLDDVETELMSFTGDPKLDAHDDVVDTLSYAAELLPYLEQAAAVPATADLGVTFGGGPGGARSAIGGGTKLAGIPGVRVGR